MYAQVLPIIKNVTINEIIVILISVFVYFFESANIQLYFKTTRKQIFFFFDNAGMRKDIFTALTD
jgi:hypothetical protein